MWSKFRQSALGKMVRGLFPQKVVNFGKHLPLAILASFFYQFPAKKLKIIGVTGTDGKTTTVNLLFHILREAGLRVAVVSTVSAKIGEAEIDTGFHVTAPDPWLLQKLFRKMVDKKVDYVVLEVTSHGLDQFRLYGLNFKIGVLTNITHEHLDYHKTYDNYLETKAKLFQHSLVAIINRDDESYKFVSAKCNSSASLRKRGQSAKLVTYGIKNMADFTPKSFKFETSLPGEYNQYNCLAAIAVASQLKIPNGIIRKSIASFKGVVGRMEEINLGQDFKIFVDFAHTPNALEQVLRTLKSQNSVRQPADKTQKLIVVFGAAGLRDRTKRPIMGEVACSLAQLIVLTSEDPRTEDANDIIDQIAVGCKKAGGLEGKNFYRIPDRQEAISFAINKLAQKGDIVIICGKGHEKSMCFGQTEYPWSDQEAVRKALKGG